MLNELETAVRRVGAELLVIKDTAATEGVWEGTQLKTEADNLAHNMMIDHLSNLAPNIPIISEEDRNSQKNLRPGRYFIIDPIDGTASYSAGFPGYVTQVALIEHGTPILAAVFAPATDDVYLASRGGGSTLNGQQLKISPEPGKRILIDNYPEPRGSAVDAISALNATDYIECGSISLKICKVADGSAQIFYKDVVVRDWDVAAPELVLREAGGIFFGLDGTPFDYCGSFEKPGLIATSTLDLATDVHKWLETRMFIDTQGPRT